jgi:PLP dependent protein
MIVDIARSLRERVEDAARRAGRDPSDVDVMAVTKFVPAERVLEACRGGIRLVGENRVQEAESKIAALASFPEAQDLTWHLIGHLQSNKAKKAANLFNAVQSLDGAALAEKLDAEAAKLGKVLSCLAEVKVSDEPTKFGLAPEALDEFLGRAAEFRHLSRG